MKFKFKFSFLFLSSHFQNEIFLLQFIGHIISPTAKPGGHTKMGVGRGHLLNVARNHDGSNLNPDLHEEVLIYEEAILMQGLYDRLRGSRHSLE